MVTSAENRGWAGLPAPSLVRTAKIATIEARDAIPLGQVAPDVRAKVLARIAEWLGKSP